MKNTDKIKQLNPDELAEFLLGQPVLELNCERCPYLETEDCNSKCKDDAIKWLEEESE